MTETAAVVDPAPPLGDQVWGQLQAAVRAITGWRTLLVDTDGRPPAPGDVDGSEDVACDPGLVAAVQRQCRTGEPAVLLAPGEDAIPLRWIVLPVAIADQVAGALLVGGLRAAELAGEGPSLDAADAAEAARRLVPLVHSISQLSRIPPPQRASLEHRDHAARRRTDALYHLSTRITATLERAPLVQLLLTETRQVLGADRAAVFLLTGRQHMTCIDAVGLSPEHLAAVDRWYAESAGGRAHESRKPVYIVDAARDPGLEPWRELAVREGFRSMIVLPFVQRGEPIGGLTLYYDTVHEYDKDESVALGSFANQVAVALANAHLVAEAARQVRWSTALADVARLLNAGLDLGQVLGALSRAATSVLGETDAIYLLRKNDETLALAAYAAGEPPGDGDRAAFLVAHPPRLGEAGIGQAVLRGEVCLVEAGGPDSPAQPDPYLMEFGAYSYLVVPLLARKRLIGALVVWLFSPAIRFTAEDIQRMTALADHAALALENARLYERELRAQKAKDEFLAFVSHELRTPLTAILGYSQLIRKSMDEPHTRFAQQVNLIWSQAQRLHRLIETILDISSIEQGQLALNLERLDLWPVVDGALERLRATSRAGLHFEVLAATPAAWLTGDRRRLEQVFGHLIANAIKYSPVPSTILIALAVQDSRAIVTIRDDGPGMSEAQVAELFQRYYQGDTPLNRTGGLGLGLYISRGIVEQHGGRIWAESVPGAGSTFLVELAAAPPAPPA